ncbi:MAG: MFS transporter [Thermoplasmatales archaeon]|nr:MFS transporter [Thermoplasmatales archaeon]MCW6169609.1 MFS transporter [Thermoplasmatales archaeon]
MLGGFNGRQKYVIGTIGLIEIVRLFGIFMILPVLEIYAHSISNSPFLVALAFGIYGLAMALFQFVFGRLSDRIGRKSTIMIAMIPYIVGNLICFIYPDIYVLIIGRFIAGAGAVGSAGVSLVQESVPENKRNTAMALLGIPVGLAFLLGLLAGPTIGYYIGLRDVFLVSVILGLISIIIMIPLKAPVMRRAEKFRVSIVNTRTISIGIAGFFVSFIMIEFFYYFQVVLTTIFTHSNFILALFIPALIGGAISVALAGLYEKSKGIKYPVISISAVLLSTILIFPITEIYRNLYPLEIGAFLFFIGYSMYEIVFPPLVIRFSRLDEYGANIGFFNTFQHTGQFLGGFIAGNIIGFIITGSGMIIVFLISFACLAVSILALTLASRSPRPIRQIA